MSTKRSGGVVVANVSSNPEALHGAKALARAGMLGRYHVPLATTERLERRVGRLPGKLADPLLRELRRRRLPDDIPPSLVQSTATLADLRRVAASRLGRPREVRDRLAHAHRAAFDRGVARALGSSDRAVFALAGVAQQTTRQARRLGVPSVLNCPIGHHAGIRSLMREEEQLNPDWAATLQGQDFPDWVLEAHAEELAAADHILVLSEHAKRTFVERGVEESKMTKTPLGVDLELFRPREREDDGVFRVIFVGQVTQRKGLSYLVDGFELAAIPNSELLLVGEVIGTSEPWANRPGVRHVSPLPRNELPDQYRLADVYVLPSLAEGFPLTTIEAMASGIPVIISTHTFADEVVTDGEDGFIVPIRDAEAIAERLRALAADPDRRAAIGRAARARAEQFPWSRYGEQIVEIMRGILDEGESLAPY